MEATLEQSTLEQIKALIVESEERTKRELKQELEQGLEKGLEKIKQEVIQEVRQELSTVKQEIIKWVVGLVFGSVVLIATVTAMYTGSVTLFAQSLMHTAPPAVSVPQTPAKTN